MPGPRRQPCPQFRLAHDAGVSLCGERRPDSTDQGDVLFVGQGRAGHRNFGGVRETPQSLHQSQPVDRASTIKNTFNEIQHRAGFEDSFGEFAARHVNVKRCGLAPFLIVGFCSKTATTFNYDTLVEDESRVAGKPVSVLSDNATANTDRWLLNLHGSATSPESIVVTRDDYPGCNSNRVAPSSLAKVANAAG